MQVMLVGSTEGLPIGFGDWMTEHNWSVEQVPDAATAAAQLNRSTVDAVVFGSGVVSTALCSDGGFFRAMKSADAQHIAAVVVGADTTSVQLPDDSLVDLADRGITSEELSWRLNTLTRFQTQLRQIEQQLHHTEALGARLQKHFLEIDDEMRLASRLQRDFLPHDVEQIGPLRFGTIYRPATFVSGDVFDIQRLDERHVGVYLADAVGHGVAAGLLTMFIRQALITKRIKGDESEIVEPGESLRMLNNSLAKHSLPNCQFVTCVYCVVNIETLEMTYARGGHPYPYVISPDGEVHEMKAVGGLMGLFEDMECVTKTVQLRPGDKVLLYTDGIEDAFDAPTPSTTNASDDFHSLVPNLTTSVEDTIARLTQALDAQEGSLTPMDDVTVVAIEVLGDA